MPPEADKAETFLYCTPLSEVPAEAQFGLSPALPLDGRFAGFKR